MDVALLKETFEAAKPIAIDVVSKFYEILFERTPAAKGLFENVDMETQKKVLANSIAFVVENVEDGERLTEYLHKMGARHVDYGTQPEHYPLVGDALLSALEFYMGEGWTDEVKQTWTEAYQFIADTMIEGATMAGQSEEPEVTIHPEQVEAGEVPTQTDSNVVEMPVSKVGSNIDFELSDDTKQMIEQYARSIFEDKIKTEFDACFDRLKSEYSKDKIEQILKSA